MSTSQEYAVYLTAATASQAAGTVANRVIWDGTTTWAPPAGQLAVADPERKYPLGSVYTTGTS